MAKKSRLSLAFKVLREEGWLAEMRLPCCQRCAWSSMPFEHERGPFKGQEVDLQKVIFMHGQSYAWYVRDYDANLHHGGNVKNLKRAVEILEDHGLEIFWNGRGDSSISAYDREAYELKLAASSSVTGN